MSKCCSVRNELKMSVIIRILEHEGYESVDVFTRNDEGGKAAVTVEHSDAGVITYAGVVEGKVRIIRKPGKTPHSEVALWLWHSFLESIYTQISAPCEECGVEAVHVYEPWYMGRPGYRCHGCGKWLCHRCLQWGMGEHGEHDCGMCLKTPCQREATEVIPPTLDTMPEHWLPKVEATTNPV